MSGPSRSRDRTRRVTALEVARLAGVSRSAVSRTLTEGASVSADTRAKVLKAAEALGYHRNALVRGMITRRSGIIGVVTGGLENPFLAIALELLSRRLQRDGRKAFIYSGDADSDLQRVLPGMIEYRVDGCMFLTNDLSPHAAARYTGLGIPLVLVFSPGIERLSQVAGPAPVGAVSADNFEASRRMGQHMAEMGGRRFGYVSGHPDSNSNFERQEGFRQGLADRGARLDAIVCGGFVYAEALVAARKLFGPAAPDAVFCGNDLMAMAVLDVARGEFGLRVPQDVTVAGFDDIPLSAGAAYDLTSIRQAVPEMIDRAADLMSSFIDHPDAKPREITVPAEVMLRGSTRRAA